MQVIHYIPQPFLSVSQHSIFLELQITIPFENSADPAHSLNIHVHFEKSRNYYVCNIYVCSVYTEMLNQKIF